MGMVPVHSIPVAYGKCLPVLKGHQDTSVPNRRGRLNYLEIVIDRAIIIRHNHRQIQSMLSLWRNSYEVYESNELCFAYHGLFR